MEFALIIALFWVKFELLFETRDNVSFGQCNVRECLLITGHLMNIISSVYHHSLLFVMGFSHFELI